MPALTKNPTENTRENLTKDSISDSASSSTEDSVSNPISNSTENAIAKPKSITPDSAKEQNLMLNQSTKNTTSPKKKTSLSAMQKRAQKIDLRPCLLLAGPGSGKTSTLIERVRYLLEFGVKADEILIITFTRRASLELYTSLSELDICPPVANTLHALALEHGLFKKKPKLLSDQEARTVFATVHNTWDSPQLKEAWSALSHARESVRQEYMADSLTQASISNSLTQASISNSLPQASLSESLAQTDRTSISIAKEPLHKAYIDLDYANFKKAHNYVDHTDLLEIWLHALQNAKASIAELAKLTGHAGLTKRTGLIGTPGRTWKYILVDEIQDLSPLELSLVQHLLPSDGKGLFAIGDADQSIYPFHLNEQSLSESRSVLESGKLSGELERSSLVKQGQDFPDELSSEPEEYSSSETLDKQGQNMLADRLKEIWPNLNILSLEDSYRCPTKILDLANDCLGSTTQSLRLKSSPKLKAAVRFTHAPDAQQEAKQIAQNIAWLLGDCTQQELQNLKQNTKGFAPLTYACLSPSDIVILVRLKSLMPPLQKALEEHDIPYSCPEKEAFFHDKMVQEIIQLHDQYPNESLKELWVLLQMNTDTVKKSSAYARFCNEFARCGTWENLLKEISLLRDIDCVRAKSEHVQIMTMHAVKGLEFKAVFIPALEESFMPFYGMDTLLAEKESLDTENRITESLTSQKTTHENAILENTATSVLNDRLFNDTILNDERRLLYVALTRAQKGLFLSCATERSIYGKTFKFPPSSLLNLSLLDEKFLVRKTKINKEQLNLLG